MVVARLRQKHRIPRDAIMPGGEPPGPSILSPVNLSLVANFEFWRLSVISSPASSLNIMENGSSSEGKDPSAFLGEIIGAPVIVKLNSGVVYKGNT